MQKIVNVLAVASAAVSLAVVGTVGYVFVNKDAIIKSVTDGALESVLGGGIGGAVGGGAAGLGVPDVGGSSLPLGSNDLTPSPEPQASAKPGLPSF